MSGATATRLSLSITVASRFGASRGSTLGRGTTIRSGAGVGSGTGSATRGTTGGGGTTAIRLTATDGALATLALAITGGGAVCLFAVIGGAVVADGLLTTTGGGVVVTVGLLATTTGGGAVVTVGLLATIGGGAVVTVALLTTIGAGIGAGRVLRARAIRVTGFGSVARHHELCSTTHPTLSPAATPAATAARPKIAFDSIRRRARSRLIGGGQSAAAAHASRSPALCSRNASPGSGSRVSSIPNNESSVST